MVIVLFVLANFDRLVFAAEGGTSHYWPGTMASAIDRLTPAESLVVNVRASRHEGRVTGHVPISGLNATAVNIESERLTIGIHWNSGWRLTEDWSYSMGVELPYVSQKVTANLVANNAINQPVGREMHKDSGVGDIVLSPVMLSYEMNRTWRGDFRFAIYAPTGSYEVGKLANTGKNYWSFEPTVALVHIEPTIGREFSVFGGVILNTKNSDTDYHTGAQIYLESTYVQYAILLGGYTGIGVSGYFFEQLKADSGNGATQGGFKSHGGGLGPVISYRRRWSGSDIMVELKWLYSLENVRAPEGDVVFFKLNMTH